jgi:hypothetical protein
MRFYAACARRLQGQVALAEGGANLAEATKHFQDCMQTFEELGAQNELGLAWFAYGEALLGMGDAQGIDYLKKAELKFEELKTIGELPVVRDAIVRFSR